MTSKRRPRRVHGRYRLVERLARGGSADVWHAHDEHLSRAVAVKVLHPHLVLDATARRRLVAEARAAASLDHPGIVDVYDVVDEGENPAIIMERIDGEALDVRLARDGRLAATEVARVGAELAEALAYAHEHGVVHRDVKPSNAILDRDGRAHLADFGICYSLARTADRLTATGQVIGTPRYLAPELLEGHDADARSDIYGLGAVLFEALTGRPPYEETAPMKLARAQAAGPPELPDIDRSLARIVQACLAADPRLRPQHAAMVGMALRQWLQTHEAAASGATASHAAASAATAPAPEVTAPIPSGVDRGAATQTMALPAMSRATSPSAPPEAAAGPRASMSSPSFGRRVAALVAGLAVVGVLLVALATLPPAIANGPSPSQPVEPAWMTSLLAQYAAACDQPMDPALLAGLSQADAEEEVQASIEECSTATQSGGNSGSGGGGNGHGKGRKPD